MSSEINELQTSLNFARSEAVKRGQQVDVCPLSGTVCSTNNPLDWSGGWAVLVDGDSAPLRSSPALTHGDTLKSNSGTSPTFSPAGYTFFSTPIKLHDSNSTSSLYRCVTFSTGSWKTEQGAPCS
jgi:type IV fimbrial biogenesis protein FimT